MKVLITGGAGYLGSVLVEMLLTDLDMPGNIEVTVVDNLMYGQAPLNHLCVRSDFNVVRGDVRDLPLMQELISTADVIIPLAALVGAPLCENDQIAATTTNTGAIAAMMQKLSPEQWVIAPISNSGYGIGQGSKACTEDTPMLPVSLYGMTKVEAEKYILGHANAISLRLATVFGMSPRMRIDLLVNDFVHRAVTDRALTLFEPGHMRNFIHIRDVARAFCHTIVNFDKMKGQSYNVGLSTANISKEVLCEKIRQHVPEFVFTTAPIGKDPDQRDYIVSNAKIEASGFHPAYSLDDGIRELIKGYSMLRNTRYGNN
jgi:nucleoside-diphosphate-sugar epimerase